MEPGDVNLDAEILKIQKITVNSSEFIKNIEKIKTTLLILDPSQFAPQK
jgi:hypothetical protein